MSKLRIFPLCFLSLALTACTVGPRFKQPEAVLPETWEGSAAENVQTPLDITQWWKRFNDDKLTDLIERAFAGNIDLAMARSRIQQARWTLGITRSGLFPAADLDASFSQSGQGNAPSGHMYSAGASASWELDVFGGLRRDLEADDADYRAAFADKCAAQVALAAEVAQNYFSYRGLQQELIITRSNLELQKKTLDITQTRRDGGFESELNLVRARAEVESTSSEIPTLEAQLEQTRHALEYLLGLPTGALVEELKEPAELVALEKFVPELGVPAALVQRRPDILYAAYKLRAATARIGAAEADFYPRFFVAGNIYYKAPNISDVFRSQSKDWSVGPSVSWNIFSAGKTVYNVKLQKALTEEVGLSWNDAVLNAFKEVEDALVAIEKEKTRVQILDKLVDSNRIAFDYSRRSYEEGLLEFLDLLDTQRSLLSSEQKQVLSRQQLASYVVDLYKALGGGWTEAELEKNDIPENAPIPGKVAWTQKK